MHKRFVFVLIVISIVGDLLLVPPSLFAQDNNCSNNTDISCLQEKLSSIRQQKNTLSSQIQEMDTQIYIKTLTIQKTEQKITQTQNEIETLTTRIGNLDFALTDLSKRLIRRIVFGYKKRRPTLFDLFINADTASDLINSIKYQKTTQNNNQKLLVQAQEAKTNFEEQKLTRETKKKELDSLITSLQSQKDDLKNQQAQKQKLLADTNNDEATYQSLLAQAQAQAKGFKTFVQSAGGGIIAANAFGNGSDGAYYSQRDERWANQAIGYSSNSILDVGCLLTSIAMFAKKHGDNVTPSDIAANPSRFYLSTAYMKNPWPGVAGKSYVDFFGSRANIGQELDAGNQVIVGISYSGSCSYGGDHFVLLLKKDGDDFIMHDPIYGPDLKFSSHYSAICSAATFK